MRDNTLIDCSSFARPDREASHCVVEAREYVDEESGAIRWQFSWNSISRLKACVIETTEYSRETWVFFLSW